VTFPVSGLDLRHHVQKKTAPPTAPQPTTARGGAAMGGSISSNSKLLGSSWLSWKPGRQAPEASEEYMYDLYAVCNHYGNMQGGHYTGRFSFF